jgi:two-component system cell cycle sensor histidine kinase/response regulator CckA
MVRASTESRTLLTPERATILLAEDDDAVRRFVILILKEHGFQVLQAKDGKEALKIAAAYDGPIHVLLADVMMPELDGPSLARQLRITHPNVRPIFMSGYTAGLQLPDGRCGFVKKPFATDALIDTIQAVLAQPPKQPRSDLR